MVLVWHEINWMIFSTFCLSSADPSVSVLLWTKKIEIHRECMKKGYRFVWETSKHNKTAYWVTIQRLQFAFEFWITFKKLPNETVERKRNWFSMKTLDTLGIENGQNEVILWLFCPRKVNSMYEWVRHFITASFFTAAYLLRSNNDSYLGQKRWDN